MAVQSYCHCALSCLTRSVSFISSKRMSCQGFIQIARTIIIKIVLYSELSIILMFMTFPRVKHEKRCRLFKIKQMSCQTYV